MAKIMNGGTDTLDLLAKIREGINAQSVIGEPISRDGITVVPVARVSGTAGGGGGSGPGETGKEPAGAGAGFAITSKPVGAFVVKEGAVSWRPAVDVNKIILGGQVVAFVAVLVLRSVLKSRRNRRFGKSA